MSQDTMAVPAPPLRARSTERPGQRSIVLALVAIVVALDQATKWWAWRHVFGALINSGGDLLVGPVVGSWYADTLTGGLLDLLSVGFLSIAVPVLVRRRRPIVVLAPAALMIGGWGSNLLDRLGMHSWTAPGSTRGAVDFLPVDHYRFNLADLVILVATALFVLSVGVPRLTAIRRSFLAGTRATARHPAIRLAGSSPLTHGYRVAGTAGPDQQESGTATGADAAGGR